nr:GTPase [uncultured Oscillibacter sp.]
MDVQKEKKVLDALESDIMNADIPDSEKNKLMKNYLRLKEQKINLMITGATGCGKSSTINALFNTEVAKVGVGVDPETMDIQKYELDNLILWDSPGLGDGKEADNRHAKNIISKLHEQDKEGNLLIDLVLVILDGSTKDLGTSYELIKGISFPFAHKKGLPVGGPFFPFQRSPTPRIYLARRSSTSCRIWAMTSLGKPLTSKYSPDSRPSI